MEPCPDEFLNWVLSHGLLSEYYKSHRLSLQENAYTHTECSRPSEAQLDWCLVRNHWSTGWWISSACTATRHQTSCPLVAWYWNVHLEWCSHITSGVLVKKCSLRVYWQVPPEIRQMLWIIHRGLLLGCLWLFHILASRTTNMWKAQKLVLIGANQQLSESARKRRFRECKNS